MSGKVSAFIRNLPLGCGFKCYVITSKSQSQRILTMSATPLTHTELLAQPADDYMNAVQQQFFRSLLLSQRSELQTRIAEEFAGLRERETSSDPADIGSAEEHRQLQLRLLEREKKLLDKIDEALDRLARGEYGWCVETGEPIGLKRLLLRPTASLCVEAKERQEQREKPLRHTDGA
jgi:DnaK suppressor protein